MSEVFYAVYDFADVNNVVDTTYHDASVLEVKTARVAKVVAESVDEVRNVVVGVLAPSSHVTVLPESNFVINVDEPAGFPTVTPEGETRDVAETPLTESEQAATTADTDADTSDADVSTEPVVTADSTDTTTDTTTDNPATADGTGEATAETGEPQDKSADVSAAPTTTEDESEQ